MLHEDDDVAVYRQAVGRITEVSLPPDKSGAFIAELTKRMEQNRVP